MNITMTAAPEDDADTFTAVNQRGIPIDRAFIEAALAMEDRIRDTLGETVEQLSAYELLRGELSSESALRAYCQTHGVTLPRSLTAAALEAVAAALGKNPLATILRCRIAIGRSSPKVLIEAKRRVERDGRLRNVIHFRHTITGRHQTLEPNLQNLPRPVHGVEVQAATEAILAGDLNALAAASGGEPMTGLISVVRGMIAAPQGMSLLGADLSGCEPRMMLYMLDDQAHLDQFRRFDAGEGPSPYACLAGRILQRDPRQLDPAQVAIGKAAMISLNYGLGESLFAERCQDSGIDLAAQRLSAKAVVKAYRQEYAAVPDFWRRCLNAVDVAWRARDQEPITPHLAMERRGGDLAMLLPSGRAIVYRDVRMERNPDTGRMEYAAGPQADPIWLVGHVLCNHAVQGTCADHLTEIMIAAHHAGIEVVLPIHDELVAQAPASSTAEQLQQLVRIMCRKPEWAADLPVLAKPWSGQRFGKA